MKKLRNKKTGEIGYLIVAKGSDYYTVASDELDCCGKYDTLSDLNEEWQDYEEPKEHWCINEFGTPEMAGRFNRENIYDKSRKIIGNDFKTEEEAEKAVEKLKIFNKLKQKGFVFSGWYYSTEGQLVILADNHEFSETEPEDLTKLFGDKIC